MRAEAAHPAQPERAGPTCPGEPSTCLPGFPDGYATAGEPATRSLVLSALRGIKPFQLHELAWSEGTAEASLAAIRAGAAGSPADRGGPGRSTLRRSRVRPRRSGHGS